MYGGTLINDGKLKLDDDMFSKSYQNDEEEGNKKFLILWLHAYKYLYNDIKVKTKIPDWAKNDFKLELN